MSGNNNIFWLADILFFVIITVSRNIFEANLIYEIFTKGCACRCGNLTLKFPPIRYAAILNSWTSILNDRILRNFVMAGYLLSEFLPEICWEKMVEEKSFCFHIFVLMPDLGYEHQHLRTWNLYEGCVC